MTSADNASTGLFGWIRVGSRARAPHPEADTRFGALWRTLRRDSVALASLAAIAVLAGLAAAALLFAALEPWARAAAFARPALAVVALTAGTARLGRERRLWTELAGAIVLWALARALLALAAPPTVGLAVVAGALFAAAFAAFLDAVERPLRHRAQAGRPAAAAPDGSGSTVFALGLFFYLVVIPAAVDPAADAVYRQLFYMLLVLDLYAVGRLVYFGSVIRAMRWRMLYSLLVLTMISVSLIDVAACLRIAGVVDVGARIYDLGWNVPLVGLVLAARLRHHPLPSEEAADRDAPLGPHEHLLALALLFPLIHLSFHACALLGATGEPVRDAFALIWLLTFGTMALLRQGRLETRVRRLGRELRQAEEALRRDEEARRRDRERRDARAVPRISKEKLNEAWRSIPDATVISTVAEGRILEVNDSFLRQFGYRRDEVLGKTGVELKLWVEPEDRAMMTRLLRERGAVRNLAFELTRKSGEKRLTLLSGEIVDLEGNACFVMVLRDVTELKSLEVTPL